MIDRCFSFLLLRKSASLISSVRTLASVAATLTIDDDDATI
jgi:hypothetical protein